MGSDGDALGDSGAPGREQGASGKGRLARRMLSAAMDTARAEGCDGVRFLVAERNPIAQRSYAKLGFDICGTCERWLCYQKRLSACLNR